MQNYRIKHFKEIDSTNAYALENLDGLQHGDVIQADIQHQGYGRFKRHWVSASGSNLYISIVLKPATAYESLANITQYMSLVICRLLEKYTIRSVLKWPNDVLVNGAKIAGLLGETSFQGSQLRGYVLGIGINLNMSNEVLNAIDQKATSLNLLINQSVPHDSFLNQLLEAFFLDYEFVLKNGFTKIRSEYMLKSPFIGKRIRVNASNHSYEGIAEGFTDEGCLILNLDSGIKKIFNAGDVFL